MGLKSVIPYNANVFTPTVVATPTIEAAAFNGIDVVTWTPTSDPNTTGVFVTNRMRKTVVDVSLASITGSGLSHPIAGYDYLVMQGDTNTLNYAFVHESKFEKIGTGTLHNLSFYKPAVSTIAGSVTNVVLYDGDLDLTGVSYTNAWLLKNTSRSNLTIETVGKIIGATGNEVPTSLNPGIATGRYYFSAEWASAGNNAPTKDLLVVCPPIIIPARTTFTRIGIRVVTGVASSVARLGIYKMANGVPTTLVLDAGTVSTASNNTDAEITISQTLEAGAYVLVYQSTGGATGATVKTFAFADSYIEQIYGNPSSQPDATTVEDWLYVANTGALPSSFGTPTRIRVGGGLPAVYLKVA